MQSYVDGRSHPCVAARVVVCRRRQNRAVAAVAQCAVASEPPRAAIGGRRARPLSPPPPRAHTCHALRWRAARFAAVSQQRSLPARPPARPPRDDARLVSPSLTFSRLLSTSKVRVPHVLDGQREGQAQVSDMFRAPPLLRYKPLAARSLLFLLSSSSKSNSRRAVVRTDARRDEPLRQGHRSAGCPSASRDVLATDRAGRATHRPAAWHDATRGGGGAAPHALPTVHPVAPDTRRGRRDSGRRVDDGTWRARRARVSRARLHCGGLTLHHSGTPRGGRALAAASRLRRPTPPCAPQVPQEHRALVPPANVLGGSLPRGASSMP